MVVAGDRAAEAGIEPTRRRSERLILPLDDSAVSVLQAAHPTVARGEGFEPSPSASKAGGLPLADPRIQVPIVSSALRESNPPCQVGSLGPLPLGQGHVHGKRKERESNPQGSSPTAFKAAAIASWLVLPRLPAPVGGIEPPIFGLTGRRLTIWPHRKSVSQDGWI